MMAASDLLAVCAIELDPARPASITIFTRHDVFVTNFTNNDVHQTNDSIAGCIENASMEWKWIWLEQKERSLCADGV